MKRCLCGLTALIGALLPLIASWLLLAAAIERRRAAAHNPLAPNPAQPPMNWLGPIEALVYVDPYFTGTIQMWWLLPGLLVLTGLFLWAMGVPVLRKGMSLAPTCPGVGRLASVSALVGVFLAIPWLLALVLVLSGRDTLGSMKP
jgi:hypothetical protein